MPIDSRLAARVVKLTRTARSWRQTDLATALGISRQRISQVENGRVRIGRSILVRLATALDSADLHKIARSK